MPAVKNTPFTPNPDIVAQLSGSGAAPAGFTGSSTLGAGFAPAYAATIELAPFLQTTRYIDIVTNSTIGNATLTAAFVPPAGGLLTVEIDNDATAARTITFSTGFRSTGTVTGTNSKAIVVAFVSNGTTWNEFSRSVSALT